MVSFGCEEMIEIDPPLDQLTDDNVFRSEVTAKAALSGLYSSLSQSQTQLEQLTIATGLAADELQYHGGVVATTEMESNAYTSTNSTVSTLFSDFYSSIYQANSIIEGAASSTLPEALKVRLTGEAKFIRAYCYFYLVTLFDAVPLVLETDVNVTASLPRASTTVVYAQIIQDLQDAKAVLVDDYSNSDGARYVANKYAATALLARVYLFTGDYAKAEQNAGEVIANTELYTLVPSENLRTDVFSQNNSEAIFQFPAWLQSDEIMTSEGNTLVPWEFAFSVTYSLNDALVNSFEEGDLRRDAWILDFELDELYHIPYKYKNTFFVIEVENGEYPTVLRLAEQYLIRAEARARIGSDLDGSRADLNTIRSRAGLEENTTTDATALIGEILEESRKELFLELGHRWTDLRRSGTIDAVLGGVKEAWVPAAALFPIPQGAVDANPALLPNNPGY